MNRKQKKVMQAAYVCPKCKGTSFKTVIKNSKYRCRNMNCGQVVFKSSVPKDEKVCM